MRAIAFDLDGTVLHFTREYEAVLRDAVESVAGEVREEWLETYQMQFYEHFRNHEENPVHRAFEAVDGGPDVDELVDALREEEVEMCRPPAGAREDLERLAEEFRIGVVTNGVPEWQRHKLRSYDLLDVFDTVVTSYEAGTHKPDTAPFEEFERRVDAEGYAMVGDDDADVDGATAAGWAAHRYDGEGFGALPGAIDWSSA